MLQRWQYIRDDTRHCTVEGGVSAFWKKLNKVDEIIRTRVDKRQLPSDERWRVIMNVKKRVDDRVKDGGERWLDDQDKQELTDVGISVLWDDDILEECVARRYSNRSGVIVPVVNAVKEFLNTCDELLEVYSVDELKEVLASTLNKKTDLKLMLHRVLSMLRRIRKMVIMTMEKRRFLIEEYDVKEDRRIEKSRPRGRMNERERVIMEEKLMAEWESGRMHEKPAHTTVGEDITWKRCKATLEELNRQLERFGVLMREVGA